MLLKVPYKETLMIKVVSSYSPPQAYTINQVHILLGQKSISYILLKRRIKQKLANAESDLQNLIMEAEGCYESSLTDKFTNMIARFIYRWLDACNLHTLQIYYSDTHKINKATYFVCTIVAILN